MRVLLTGGTGYIGSHAAVALSHTGHDVLLVDNLGNSSRCVVDALHQITGKNIAFFQGDVRDTDFLIHVLSRECVDAVIHFAGLKSVGESAKAPLAYYSGNVQGTISLLQAMQAVDVKTLVFSSSATVYGEPRYLPIDEEHLLQAVNTYGRTKLHIEEMLRDVAAGDASWRICCLRYFNPVGAHESGLIGERSVGLPNNLAPYIVMVAAGQLPHLNVYGHDYPTPDGAGVRDYIHVMDLAEGHVAALRHLEQVTGLHVFNLGTGRGYSVLEMLAAFETACGCSIPYRFVDRRLGDVPVCYASTEKARTVLDWQATRTVADMCSSQWRFAKMLLEVG